ncbi:hypothetical protein, partial [Ottowia thiooxydans]
PGGARLGVVSAVYSCTQASHNNAWRPLAWQPFGLARPAASTLSPALTVDHYGLHLPSRIHPQGESARGGFN